MSFLKQALAYGLATVMTSACGTLIKGSQDQGASSQSSDAIARTSVSRPGGVLY